MDLKERRNISTVTPCVLTIEVEDTVNPGVNMVFPCNEIQKTAWEVLKNFDHALILREDDPLLPAILKVYEEQGIRDGAPQNQMKGPAFQTELATAYPDCRLVVTKETMTVEGMIKIVYDLLKDKLNIAKITFTSGVNAATADFTTHNEIDRCPLCGNCAGRKRRMPQMRLQKTVTPCAAFLPPLAQAALKNASGLFSGSGASFYAMLMLLFAAQVLKISKQQRQRK